MINRIGSAVDASRWPLLWAVMAVFGTFTVTPLVLCFFDPNMPAGFLDVAGLSTLASGGIVIGYSILPTARVSVLRRPVNVQVFSRVALGIFVMYALLLFVLAATANVIPLFGAVMGAGIDEVSESREQFLKARTGWAIVFVYAHAVLAGSLVPYAIAGSLTYRFRGRIAAIAGFFFGCVLFAEKAFFLKAIIPIAVVAWRRGRRIVILAIFAASITSLMILAVITTRNISDSSTDSETATPSRYFSSAYSANVLGSPTEYMVWRAISVPIFTAVDSLSTFSAVYESRHFLGATSSLVAGVSGQQHVSFERAVFEFEWGQNATGTGSSNTVFFIEAFVNFGIPGVVVFSIMAGALLRFLACSPDPALAALWPLYLFAIYCGGLIGTLLSNGFIAVALVSLVVRCSKGPRGTSRRAY